MYMLYIQTSPHSTSCIIRAGAKCTVYALSCNAQCRVDPTRFLQQMYSGKITVTYIPVVYIDSYTFSIFSYMQYM